MTTTNERTILVTLKKIKSQSIDANSIQDPVNQIIKNEFLVASYHYYTECLNKASATKRMLHILQEDATCIATDCAYHSMKKLDSITAIPDHNLLGFMFQMGRNYTYDLVRKHNRHHIRHTLIIDDKGIHFDPTDPNQPDLQAIDNDMVNGLLRVTSESVKSNFKLICFITVVLLDYRPRDLAHLLKHHSIHAIADIVTDDINEQYEINTNLLDLIHSRLLGLDHTTSVNQNSKRTSARISRNVHKVKSMIRSRIDRF